MLSYPIFYKWKKVLILEAKEIVCLHESGRPLGFFKKIFGIKILWIPFIPEHFRTDSILKYCDFSQKNIKKTIGGAGVFYKVSNSPFNQWTNITYVLPFSPNFSFLTDIKNFFDNYSKNFKKCLRQAKRRNKLPISYLQEKDLLNVHQLLLECAENKNFKKQIDLKKLQNTFKSFGDDFFCIFIRDPLNSKIIAVRGCLIEDKYASDFIAATSLEARKSLVSYLLLDRIFIELSKRNIKYYDFSGIDLQRNFGVAKFKIDAGGKIGHRKLILFGYMKFLYPVLFLIQYILVLKSFIK